MASTITLQQVINLCSTHADLLPLTGVGGYTDEPALSLCNDAVSEIINDANDWKWNSVELGSISNPLITMMNKQDYLFAGASAFILSTNSTNLAAQAQSSGVGIDLASNSAVTVSGGVVTVNTLEPHRFQVGYVVNLVGLVKKAGNSADATKYNSTYTDTGSQGTWSTGYTITAVTSTSFSFAAGSGMSNGDILGAPGFGQGSNAPLSDFGWLTGATMMELNNTSSPPNVKHLKAVRGLPAWSKVNDPEQVAMIQNLGTGVLKFRFSYVPGSVIWAVNLIYQAAPPVFTQVSGTKWTPIPDAFGSVVRQALLYRMYRYLNSPNADNEFKKLQAEIARAKGTDQAEESNVYLEPSDSLVDYGPTWGGF